MTRVLMGRGDTERYTDKRQRLESCSHKHQGLPGPTRNWEERSKEGFSLRAFSREYGPDGTFILDF